MDGSSGLSSVAKEYFPAKQKIRITKQNLTDFIKPCIIRHDYNANLEKYGLSHIFSQATGSEGLKNALFTDRLHAHIKALDMMRQRAHRNEINPGGSIIPDIGFIDAP